MFLGINTDSVYGIISMVLLLAIIIFVLRCFGNITYAIFCYDTCCCEKQRQPIVPIPSNAIQTIVPFAQVIYPPTENTVPLITAIKITT